MYRVIQLTNHSVGAVTAGSFLPLGNITRRYGCNENERCSVFEVSTTGSNTITINESGYYHLTYTGSLVAGAAGDIVLDLLVNGIEVFTVSQTATAVGDVENITLNYVVRVLPNCSACVNNTPAIVQIRLDETSVALTGGTSNIVVEKFR